ncbi:hypothetical protein TNIN_478071 [Trichonephila inaurata madagascariensis]|uniref:Uncharacterized protein n=1 Tax=Trichonephila inaurata madagascariensis TaxID=2747483 RepID=A0A8X6X445_9ARAC|nr:hypothetical protein TNIN_478071 [Trichonephila inaurata madagascariensis]
MTCCISFFTINLVPLHNLGASIFRISIIGETTFRIKLWACKSGVWMEFKNSMGYCTASHIIIKDEVYGLVGIFLPWKLLLNGDIELLNHIISACQNFSVRKQVLIFEVMLNVRIHPGQKFVRRVGNLTTWHNDEAR